MPEFGEVQKLTAVGYKGRGYCAYLACPSCGKGRWVRRGSKNHLDCPRCRACCRGMAHPKWTGGRNRNSSGYIEVWVSPDDFFHRMATKDSYISEHRLVMAKSLERCLLPWEVVHHKNGIKDDNRLENLQLLPGEKYHLVDSNLRREVSRLKVLVEQLQQRVVLLEADNALLRVHEENLKKV